MKKYHTVLVLLIGIGFNVHALSGEYYGSMNPYVVKDKFGGALASYVFSGDTYNLVAGIRGTIAESEIPEQYVNDGTYEENGKYELVSSGKLNFIVFTSSSRFTYKKRLGILVNERRLFLCEGDRFFFHPDEDLRWEGSMPAVTQVSVSSYLKEGQTGYSGQNFIRNKNLVLVPWVEGVAGNGEREWILLQIHKKQFPTKYLVFVNGYVNFGKPKLYTDNSRIKRLRIECTSAGLNYSFDLSDTPELQTVKLPLEINLDNAQVRLTIEDVYPGDKFQDTCLGFVFPLGDLPE